MAGTRVVTLMGRSLPENERFVLHWIDGIGSTALDRRRGAIFPVLIDQVCAGGPSLTTSKTTTGLSTIVAVGGTGWQTTKASGYRARPSTTILTFGP
jgi:hypothetical protein